MLERYPIPHEDSTEEKGLNSIEFILLISAYFLRSKL
jgi:hypothetical protein